MKPRTKIRKGKKRNKQVSYNKEDFLRFFKLLRKANGNVEKAARAAKIRGGRLRILDIAKNNPWFSENFKKTLDLIQEEGADIAQNTIFRRLAQSTETAKWYLLHNRKGMERGFAKRTETVGKFDVKSAMDLNIRDQASKLKENLTVKDLRKLRELYSKAGIQPTLQG